MATLELNNLSKTYPNGYQAIKSASLNINSGEFVVIVGPSGCGKSTLLRMVAGLESITGGDLILDGKRVNDLSPSDRDIAMVFQNYALYPHMSVFDNMAYGLKIRKMDKSDIQSRVEQTAQILGLEALLKRKPKQLSGGQRQRVAMGRAIVRQPKLFLFDEPLSNLDAKLRVQMRLEMQAIHKRLGITSLYVTHDQVEAMTLAQHIVILNGGDVEQVGSPDEIYNQPASTFVAEFIGSPPMNLLPVSMTDAGNLVLEDQHTLLFSDNSNDASDYQQSQTNAAAILRSAQANGVVANKPVWLGIRPEQLHLLPPITSTLHTALSANVSHSTAGSMASQSASQSANQVVFEATVAMKELLGAEVLLYLSVHNQTVILRCASDDIVKRYQIGDTCQVGFDSQALYWFDKDSGKNLATYASVAADA
ncbi:MAG: sn-glycerol-3-phosphate ABC transporter ATP-binding protein UgpC [Psychrobacter sp.]|nr:sn-glycerol-3-phosphate ABC transporter ATP-binding protein UgpC [Psychrobacter sp.]